MIVALGVTGCIAAYKAVEVLRGLQKSGVSVRVVMTRHATEFVGPLTFQSISGFPVIAEMFAPTDDPEIKHIQVAQSIDLLLVAPATANALAKFANGIADDFLSTLYISTTAPVVVAPAMNVEMWAHPATRENVRRLRERGVQFIDPEEGYLACRTVGPGRLAEPHEIVRRACEIIGLTATASSNDDVVALTQDLRGERVLITAGPTQEALDPVRFLSNRSSGKMGFAVAEAALARGAAVTLIAGPVSIAVPKGARTISVRSAAEMYEAVKFNLDDATMVVMAAAVADYRPASVHQQKIKKNGSALVLDLEPTDDILAAVAHEGGSRVVIGFAAETENVIENARKKLKEKGADLMVANDVSASDSGFDVDHNRIALVSSEGVVELPLLSKQEAAESIIDAAMKIRSARPLSVA
ncbi:MAG TPA: bifunctional phosphopantothenoylcysteine decarboxylase/phosphopantothenate--cysteine ligase CoaBC [Blastocatellia bacterium]|nr:bifunctional phosphopantothenoylcysteine decarboxylase/phosphopantothenate--cysteine ligase CoaBC [Blastocatellia bacterium]